MSWGDTRVVKVWRATVEQPSQLAHWWSVIKSLWLISVASDSSGAVLLMWSAASLWWQGAVDSCGCSMTDPSCSQQQIFSCAITGETVIKLMHKAMIQIRHLNIICTKSMWWFNYSGSDLCENIEMMNHVRFFTLFCGGALNWLFFIIKEYW